MAAYWQLSRNGPIGRLVSNEPAVEVHIGQGQVFTLSGNRWGWKIACTVGRLWITQAGDPKDHVLRPGQQFQVSTSGVVVIQGLPSGEARLGGGADSERLRAQ